MVSLGGLLVLGYLFLSLYYFWDSSLPAQDCNDDDLHCFSPYAQEGDTLQAELWIEDDRSWLAVESCRFNLTIPAYGTLPVLVTNNTTNCAVKLPNSSRRRHTHQRRGLQARFRFYKILDSHRVELATEVQFELSRLVKDRHLWPQNQPSSDIRYLPYYKYSSQPLVIRFVSEYRKYPPSLYRRDGIRLNAHPSNRRTYQPIFYVDDSALEHSKQILMGPPEEADSRPPVVLRVQVSNIAPLRDAFNRQLLLGLSMAESFLDGSELDEIRYFLREERLYRFFLTQLISFIHLWLDYMAFRDEIRFYKGRTSYVGVSASSVVGRFFCSLVIFLYLLDSGSTSWIVLLSVLSGVVVEGWKAVRILRPRLTLRYPFLEVQRLQNAAEQSTATYDRIAVKYLGMVLYPIVVAWALYDYQNNEYKSWYSWLVSSLANAVYTFGFISLCPQLYVNYRLKSVAHLPWKVFIYKIFNTFVDDVFAFLIDMPWKHRLMTLRDDVVFLCFLVQAFIYRVDKSRVNEYGYAYSEDS